jgi:copper chaperone
MLRLRVSGMTCGHCVSAVTNAVRSVEQDAAVSVDLSSGEVRVHGDPDGAAIVRAIAKAGYIVTNAAPSGSTKPADQIVAGRKSCCCG